jgi:hypothetical protein
VTGAASGLVLEISFLEPVPVTVAAEKRAAADEPVAIALLLAPSQPGQVLNEAARRGYLIALAGTAS